MTEKKKRKKLSIAEVIEVKKLLAGIGTEKKLTQKKIAEKVGVGLGTIQNISRGANFKHVQIDELGHQIDTTPGKDDAHLQQILKRDKSRFKEELLNQDIADIKYISMKKYLNQTELAKHFNVSTAVINDILHEQTYTHIVIDEFGDYVLDDEISPENFHVPSISIVEETETVKRIDDETTEFRLKFIEGYFTKKGKRYLPKSKISKSFIFKLWNTYEWLFNSEWDDFISETMSIVTITTFNYQPDFKPFRIEHLLISGTKEHSSINSYINKAIKAGLQDYANKINDSYAVQVNNVKGWAKPTVKSTDETFSNEEGELSLSDVIGEESNHFHLNENYTANFFMDWFSKNKEKILTYEQMKFLKIISLYQRDNTYDKYTIAYTHIPEEDKPYSESAIGSMRERIKTSVEDVWEKTEEKSLRQMRFEREIGFWQEFIRLVKIKDDCVPVQNRLLSKWLIKRLNYEFMEDVLFSLSAEDVLSIRNDKEIRALTLYKIADYVVKRIEYLKGLDSKVILFYRKDEEYGGLTKDEYLERQHRQISEREKGELSDKKDYLEFRVLTGGALGRINK